MNSTSRVLVNTVVLYIKIIVTSLLSLVSVPIILKALGKSDYGLYSLVGGIITMLGFLNSSMSVSTQRFMSVAMGENDSVKENKIYCNSVILHFVIALFVSICLLCFEPIVFSGVLQIEPKRIEGAKIVYRFLIISMFSTVNTVPFQAVMNAKEDMLAYSVIGIIEAILKLFVAFILLHADMDRLILYSICMAMISLFSLCSSIVFVITKYKSLTFSPSCYFNKQVFYSLFGFAGWNTFGAISMIGRNQGLAIILNLFYGTIVNAAYGVANTINSVLCYFSSTFQKAINPQLMKSQGMNDRKRLIRIALISSKYSVLILSATAIPLIIEMPMILTLWLHEVPEYTVRMAQSTLLLSLVYQYSMGLMSSIQAVGKIKYYTITMGLLILCNIPLSYLILSMGFAPYFCILNCVIMEIVSFVVRLFMAKRLVGINICSVVKNVVVPTALCICISTLIMLGAKVLMSHSILSSIICIATYCMAFVISSWVIAFDSNIKNIITNIILKR